MDPRFCTDHLFLLVGGNPLPNAVAGQSLTVPGGTITLVHSPETASVAQRLHSYFVRKGISSIEFKEVDESKPISIFEAVQKTLNQHKPQRVGLNYTGGTKPMSVHAYRAVEQWAQAKDVTAIFTYLNPRELRIVCDRVTARGHEPEYSEYVGRSLEPRLEDLLALHNWTVQRDPNVEPMLLASAAALAKTCTHDEGFTAWRAWVCDELEANCHRPDDKWQSAGKLRAISLEFPTSDVLRDVVETLQHELGQTGSYIALGQLPQDIKPLNFCKWLHGEWLEHYILHEINRIKSRLKLHQQVQDIVPNEVEFQVDVIAIRGCQLFAVSCTTDDQSYLLKSKLFEAYVRARQVGGDEARVALVCCGYDPEKIEQQMRRDIDTEGRIRVFGRKDLTDLATRLEQWINSQSGEA